MEKTQSVYMELLRWGNSVHHLNSGRLSDVGIDDMGDLRDEVPVFREWMNDFWRILEDVYQSEVESGVLPKYRRGR